MRELLKTNDPVTISHVAALLGEAGIHFMVLDQNMSVLEGSLGVLPRRVLVVSEGYEVACTLLEEAGMGAELTADTEKNA
ncbi:DUF2007 domain-containing protein [Breoghania sp. JC706]|uniref:putative signal transducing protein n=1 Tax=Breoghania sp. JC706 TaxID=3117732 RepID=UPI00300A1EBF